MGRHIFDCREWPGECTLAISGEEEELVEAQVLHAVQVHAQQDTPQLRELIRASLRPAPVGVYRLSERT
jgi:putative lipoic acid-binding regulatory protein